MYYLDEKGNRVYTLKVRVEARLQHDSAFIQFTRGKSEKKRTPGKA